MLLPPYSTARTETGNYDRVKRFFAPCPAMVRGASSIDADLHVYLRGGKLKAPGAEHNEGTLNGDAAAGRPERVTTRKAKRSPRQGRNRRSIETGYCNAGCRWLAGRTTWKADRPASRRDDHGRRRDV
jgi:hypothetical protein